MTDSKAISNISKNNTNEICDRFYDISKIPSNGQLVLLLSMSKLHSGQSSHAVYEFLKNFSLKLSTRSIDVHLVYTNDLYFNSKSDALSLRKKMCFKMHEHTKQFRRIIAKNPLNFISKSIHYVSWDNVFVNNMQYSEFIAEIALQYKNNKKFKHTVDFDIAKNHKTRDEENISFILEETVVFHLISQQFVPFNCLLADKGSCWTLLCYQGNHCYLTPV